MVLQLFGLIARHSLGDSVLITKTRRKKKNILIILNIFGF